MTKLAEIQRKLQQLQGLRDSGALTEEAHAQARAPLERELVDSVLAGADLGAVAPAKADAAPRPSGRMRTGLALGVVALAAAGYSITGTPKLAGLTEPPVSAQAAAVGATDAQIDEMVKRLAQHLKDEPSDAKGWGMLARAYAAMGRHADAIPAFQKTLALAGESADLLADYADTMAAQTGGKLGPEGVKLVERALALNPANLKALAMLGSAAYDKADYATAVRLWEQVAAALPPDNGFLAQLQGSIAQARKLAGMPAVAVAASTTAAAAMPAAAAASSSPAPASPSPAALAATAVGGTVTLAPALAGRAAPDDTIFILARAATGPRMPLAVLRKQVRDLPLTFLLDDTLAMAPTARISDHKQVIVVARISKSGQAMPQAGDLSGQSAPVAPGARGVSVQITEVVPGAVPGQ